MGYGTTVEETAGTNSPVVGNHRSPVDDGPIISPTGSGGRVGGVRSAASNKGGEGGRLAKPGGLGTGEVAGWGVEEISSPDPLTKEDARSDMVTKTVQNTQYFTKHSFAKWTQFL